MNTRRARAIAGLLLLAFLAQACDLPSLKKQEKHAPPLAQTSFMYTADGTLITQLHEAENRVVIPFGKIPATARNAVIAIEDQRFYEHRGVDLKALLRAAYVDATAGRIVEGGSTITQQYVKNAYVGTERTLDRKIKEAQLAWQLEQQYTKSQILAKYMNTVYFGESAYGVEAAAQTFFAKHARDLTLRESALLAGLIAAPADYDPAVHPHAARHRRKLVLQEMLQQGMIDHGEFRRANSGGLGLRLTQGSGIYIAPYFVSYVKQWFLNNPRFGDTFEQRKQLLFEGGLRITTTLDPQLQEYAESAVNGILFNPNDPYGSMAVVDPRTGYVKAMVGGRDYFSGDRFSKVNLATGAGGTGRQAGSAFKPFTLVTALENGIRPSKTYAAPGSINIHMPEGARPWHVSNFADSSYSGSLTLTEATAASVNTVYAQVIQDIGKGNAVKGAEKMVEVAHAMGIESPLEAVPAATLGANPVTPLEMASAFGTLAAGGYHARPTPVSEITTPDGHVLYKGPASLKKVVPPPIASTAVKILEGVVDHGTGTAAKLTNPTRPQFGKTGTAQEYHDAWFAGAVPQLAAAVWVGYPQSESISMSHTRIGTVFGGSWPAQIWHSFMWRATKGMKVLGFPKPNTKYITVEVDQRRGCLPNKYTPPDDIAREQFLVGAQPTERCKKPDSFQEIDVPSVVGYSQQTATDLLKQSGFKVKVVKVAAGHEGTVLSQSPAGDTKARQASTVTIEVSKGRSKEEVTPSPGTTVSVPKVVGLSRDVAVATLHARGLKVDVIETPQCDASKSDCDYEQGAVWRQAPGPHANVASGTSVSIRVNP